MADAGMSIIQPPVYIQAMIDDLKVPYLALVPHTAHAALLVSLNEFNVTFEGYLRSANIQGTNSHNPGDESNGMPCHVGISVILW